MIESIVFCVISVSIIASLFMAWFFYQKARDKERMYLLAKGDKLEDIFKFQEKNKFKFIFPWLKFGIVTSSLSLSFLVIAYLVRYLENDLELFKGFLITSIIGICLAVSFLINHFIDENRKKKNG